MKTITIIEGPAGSGKTTYIRNKIQESGDTDSFVSISFADSRLPKDVPTSALMAVRNDLFKLYTGVVMHMTHPYLQNVYIDRCILSQMVYHQIRIKESNLDKGRVRFSMSEVKTRYMSLVNFLHMMVPTYMSPGFANLTIPDIRIRVDLKVILPNWKDLSDRRRSSGREYPSGEDDLRLYSMLVGSNTSISYFMGELTL
jgi:hypothetical protein